MAHKGKKTKPTPEDMPLVHPDAAGIDVGAEEHGVCVPADRDIQPIQTLSAFTCDLYRLADWLTTCRITTVVMASTGVSWIPLCQILEARGFAVALVNARHVNNVPGRPKTDRCDYRWLQKLQSYGLLAPSFRPPEPMCQLRSLLRHRDNILRSRYAIQAVRPTHHWWQWPRGLAWFQVLMIWSLVKPLACADRLSRIGDYLRAARGPGLLLQIKKRTVFLHERSPTRGPPYPLFHRRCGELVGPCCDLPPCPLSAHH